MKIKRLFAAILTALMVVSCFSFTASAQDTQTVTNPVATVQTAKANHATYRAESALTKTKLYDAVSDKIYYRFTPVTSAGSATTKLDAYGLPTINATNGVVYMAIELRSNYPVQPWVKLYHTVGTDGTADVANNSECVAAVAAQGKETWERVVIKIENSKLASFTQNHFYLFSKSWSTAATTPADAYIDIAAFGYFADEYSAKNYNFGTAIAADGKASFSVDGEVLDEIPETDPVVDGKVFIGWNANKDATKGEEITALSTIPTSDVTYHAVLTGAIQDEKAVYISANGDDANNGRHSKTPVKTLAKANELLKGEGIDTLYVVGNVDGTGTDIGSSEVPGVSGKKIYIQGYSGDGTEVLSYDGHYKYNGDVEYKNITVYDIDAGDGQHLAQGHDITFDENVIIKDKDGTSGRIGQGYYNSFNNINNTVRLNSGTWARFYYGAVTGSTITGNTEYIIDGTANVKAIYVGHGSGTSTQATKGTTKITVNGGTIAIDVGGSQGNMNSLHQGLRYYTLNGGTVSSFYTRSNDTYASYEGITVYEINKGVTITPETIGETSGTTDDSETRVVIFNDGFDAVPVGDAGAIVADVTGGNLHADVTVASDYSTTLNGFTYDLAANYYNRVKIGDDEYALTEFANGLIPASNFAAGVNTVEFYEVTNVAQKVVYVSANGNDANKGDTADAPVKTLKKVRELLDAEGSEVEKVYIIGTVEATADDKTSKNSIAIGAEGRKVTYLGYGENAILDAKLMPVYLIGEVEIDNFLFQQQTTWDGKFMTEGHDLTVGENMTFAGHTTNPDPFTYGGTSTVLTSFYYAGKGNSAGGIPTPLVNTITLNGGSITSFRPAIYSGDLTFKGEVVVNLNKNSAVNGMNLNGQGYESTINTYGSIIVNVNDNAKVTTISSEVGGNSIGNYSGLREININGGNVGTINTTAKGSQVVKNSDGSVKKTFTATKREQLMVITVNGGTLGKVTKPNDDETENSTVALIFNNGVAPVAYTDKDAYILDVTGGNVEAITTVSEDYTTATLGGFTYESADAIYDAIKITANGTAKTYKFTDLDGEISLDKLTKGAVNTLEFVNSNEAEHIKAYRDAGYDILYVAGSDLRKSVSANTAAGKKVVFALKDDLNLSGSYSLDNNGGTFVITSAGGNINLGTTSITLGTDKDADITFDHIALSKTSGERGINAVGNNLTLTETVTVSSGEGTLFYVNAAGDGGDPAKPSKGNTITIETPSKVSVRGGGWSGNYTKGDVNFVFGKNAQSYLTAAGKVGNDNQPDTKGNITVTVKDNAKLLDFTLAEGKSFLTGNLDITIKDKATVDVLKIANAVTGNATINIQSGTVGNITITDGKVTGRSSVIVDTDNATVGTITGAKYAIKFNGNLGKATPSADYATIALTPAATAKYVRVTNGTTVKEYNVAGEEVELLADLSALALAEGATTVEFLADGTEAPKTANYTIETYTMGTDGAYGEAVTETKTAEVGTTVTIEPEEKTGFTISTGSTLSGTVTADGLLTLAVYYDRNSYKLYTKADAEAEAVVAGTYYYEEALTAPATPEKDGYTFKAWDPTVPATMPANDVTLTATWEKNAPTTATLKFYDGDTLFVEKTVAIGATLDILPLMSDVKGGNHATYANDIIARPSKKGYKLVGWATTNGGEAVTVTANADASYYAVWEEVNELTAGEDFTLTIVDGTTVTESPVPADAISFIRGDEKNSFAVNSNGVKYYDTTVTDLSAYGVSFVAGKTSIGSWYGGSDAQKTVLCPDGTKSIWYKWNDSYLSAKPGVEGEYNVAYWIYTGSEGSTRAFTLDAPGKSGVVYLNGAGTKDHFVQFKATLTADSELKYSAALDFDDNTVKGAQLLGIYIWKDAPKTANATFNANGGAWGEETTKTVVTNIGETPVAPEAPTKAGYTFAGWEPALAAMVADGATYTAKWEVIVRTFENAVYLGNAGNDDNDGLTPATLVKTLKRAQAIVLANEDIDTIVVVGTYSKSNESSSSTNDFLKGANRKITITGQTVESVFDMKYGSSDSHLRLGNDIEFNNLKMNASSGDGGIMSMGYELTFGEGMTINSQKAGFLHYNAQLKDNGVVNVYSGTIGRLDLGVQSGQTWRGTSTINVYGGAVGAIRNGHGWKGEQWVYGINNVNVNGGKVGPISLTSTADTGVTSYAGLRYFTINAGTVGDIETVGSSVSKIYDTDKSQTADVRAGVTVVEYNGGTIGTIKPAANKQTGVAEDDDATRVVILNNGMTATVTDAKAIVVKPIGAKLHAATNAQETYPADRTNIDSNWGKAIVLKGFTYELPAESTANAVKVDGGEAILLENYANDIITGITTAGEHTVEFVTVEITEPEATNKVYLDQTNGNDENNGETAASAVKTIAAAQALLGDEDLDTLVIVGQFLLPDDDAKNTLGYAGKTITITGFDSSAVFAIDNNISGESKWNDERLPLAGAVVFENITIIGDDNDARIELNGNNFTFGDGVKFSKKSVNENNNVSVAVQSIPAGKTPEITVKSGAIHRLLTGPFNAGTVSGTVNINVAGKDAFVQMITIAHNYNSNGAAKYGITNVTVDDGEVSTIGLTPTGTVSVANYDGLRHYVINGGSVANIELAGIKTRTGTISGKESTKTATLQSGVNVVEINGGAVGKIYRSESDIDDSVSAIIFNNGTYAEGIVTDTTAIVADVKGGTLTAQTTAPYAADATEAQIQEWSKTVAITGYAFTTDKAYVRINGTEYAVSEFVSEAALTAEEVSGVIPADKLTAGYNSVLFTDVALITVNWTVDGETVKTDSVDAGTAVTAPEAPVKEGYTFKGWAVDGTTEIIDTFAFTTSTTLVAVFEKNVVLIDVKWIVDGEEVKAENVEAGSTVTAPEAPVKDGFTFKGWAIEGTTEIIDTFTFTTSTTLVAVFEEIPAEPEETAIYKTYGVYDEETGTYTVELKVSGVKAHMGSFGFVLPGLVSVTAAEGVTLFAEEEAAGAVVSPIFAKGEDFYANTWAIEAAPGYIDATQEEVLIATFVLEADASFPEKFEEYVVDFADAKYFADGHYLVAPKSDSLDTDKIAVIYESHTDSIKEIEVPELEYKTYGTYNPADGSYTIEVKFIGGKINAGAFGIAFNSDYMTYDPEADGAFVLAEGIANYLDVALENTADGIAFVWDGSADAENGFVDATDAEVLIATIKAEMSEDQRAAYEAAGTPAFELLDITGVEDAELYFNGTDYLVALYADDLAVERVAAKYIAHADEEAEVTTADVTVKVTFADKAGATTVNLGYITVNGGEAVVIDDEGNEEATVEYVIEGANVGETLTIKVEKNGYLAAVAEVKVSAAGNTVEITTVAGDIKESTEAISGDGEVDLSDFIRVVRAFDENATDNYKNTVDLNEDGAVNVTDLGLVKANFNKTSADVTE